MRPGQPPKQPRTRKRTFKVETDGVCRQKQKPAGATLQEDGREKPQLPTGTHQARVRPITVTNAPCPRIWVCHLMPSVAGLALHFSQGLESALLSSLNMLFLLLQSLFLKDQRPMLSSIFSCP